MRRAALTVFIVIALLAGAGWWLTEPAPLSAADLPDHAADIANGEQVFYAAGCASCHAAPGAKGDDKLKLAGGLALATAFGTFRVPNISPDPDHGIGGWSTLDFVNAVKRGVSPAGEHLYPAFPYTSYVRMRTEDAIDLKAFIDTLPPVASDAGGHELRFPFNIRRGIGLWKRRYLDGAPAVALAAPSEAVTRGQYLAEALGHCGECHTRRDVAGGLVRADWLAGAPDPEGKGRVPNITPGPGGLTWSEDEIVEALKSGFTPDYDTLGGSMADVQANLAHLPDDDLRAIAAYLKAIPAHPDAAPRPQS